jgi:hypothetical protein
LAAKITLNDVKKLEVKMKELEEEIKELYKAPDHRKSHHIRVIRDIQNYIEKKIKEYQPSMTNAVTGVKFPFENFVYVYRVKEGYFETQINEALYKPPGSFVYDEQTGKVEKKKETVADKVIKKTKSDPLDNQLETALSRLVPNETKRALLKQSVKEQIEAAKQKAGNDYKVTVQVGKNESGKPSVKVKLIKK